MPPKTPKVVATAATAFVSDDETSLADIARLLKYQGDQLVAITVQMAKVDKIEAEVKDLRTLIVALRDENKDLKAQVVEKDKVIPR